jgi:hypothetical protein
VYTENVVRIVLEEESLTVRKRRGDELLEHLRSLVGQPHNLRTSRALIRSRAPNRSSQARARSNIGESQFMLFLELDHGERMDRFGIKCRVIRWILGNPMIG